LTVERIMRALADGMSVADILDAHPHLTPADIDAAQAFAEEYMVANAGR
jgi:uncharacterized protein (DUF433 family)